MGHNSRQTQMGGTIFSAFPSVTVVPPFSVVWNSSQSSRLLLPTYGVVNFYRTNNGGDTSAYVVAAEIAMEVRLPLRWPDSAPWSRPKLPLRLVCHRIACFRSTDVPLYLAAPLSQRENITEGDRAWWDSSQKRTDRCNVVDWLFANGRPVGGACERRKRLYRRRPFSPPPRTRRGRPRRWLRRSWIRSNGQENAREYRLRWQEKCGDKTRHGKTKIQVVVEVVVGGGGEQVSAAVSNRIYHNAWVCVCTCVRVYKLTPDAENTYHYRNTWEGKKN